MRTHCRDSTTVIEWTAPAATPFAQAPSTGAADQPSRPSCEQLDLNADGYVREADAERLLSLTQNRLEGLDADRDGRMSPHEFEVFQVRKANDRYRQPGTSPGS